MQVVEIGSGVVRRPQVDGAPEVELLVGTARSRASDWPSRTFTVPPGGGMPEHDHGESAAIVAVRRGRIVMRSEGEERVLLPGTVAVVDRGERVSLRNPDGEGAGLLAFFTPASFAGTVASWPAVRSAE